MSSTVIVGVDEAGRGPLAGPVYAGACHLPCPAEATKKGWMVDGILIGDSKQLSEEERRVAYDWIITHCAHGIGFSTAADIDAQGILEATNSAMQQAVAMLAKTMTPTYLLVDGRDAFWFDYPHSSVIRGDSLEPAIAAASILAKVSRDRHMKEMHEAFPQYGFESHKGYAAPGHIAILKSAGPCVIHRTSFLHNILAT